MVGAEEEYQFELYSLLNRRDVRIACREFHGG